MSSCTLPTFSYLFSPRNGGKGLFPFDWIDGGIDGFLGGELDFNPDSQAERTKPQHVHYDKSQ